MVLERVLTNGHEDRKVSEQICWSLTEITVLEFQNSSKLVNVKILRCHHVICDVLFLGLGKLAGLPSLTEIRFLARAKYLPFFFLALRLLKSFLVIRGPTDFLHERIVIK